MTQDHVKMISRTLAAGLSRRGVLRALGVGGAGGLLAVVEHEAVAGERPHQRLHDRTPQRNRKQRINRRRNKDQNSNNQNNNQNNNTNQGNQLGSAFLGTSVAFVNAIEKVLVVGGDNGYDSFDFTCPQGFNATLYASDDPEWEFTIQDDSDDSAWGEATLWMQAFNPDFGQPGVVYKRVGCTGDCETTRTLAEDEGFWIDWYDNRFLVHRLPDSSDYKMFVVTAYS